MNDKKILTIQDISCVGQCSLTVALPIISSCGHETCVIPSAVLSTHTGGFSGYTFRDLTEDIPLIQKHWEKENISFDAIYTGYLGSVKQIEYIKELAKACLKKEGLLIVDPAMADNGKLYPAFNQEYVENMKTLCFSADIILPNITEACLLTNIEYQTEYNEEYIRKLIDKLKEYNAKTIVLTGVSYNKETTGVVVYQNNILKYYAHKLIEKGCHGTGDVYASAFVGALMSGKNIYDSAKIAADYTLSCIEYTKADVSHWYGVKFEKCLPKLIKDIYNN